jgi:LPS-assembly lipoprotein
MWWLRRRPLSPFMDERLMSRSFSVLSRLTSVLGLAVLLAGCFQPLYGDRSATGQPGLREVLSAVQVNQIDAPNGTPEARLAVELRNHLLFDLTGGSGTNSPTHELTIRMTTNRTAVIVDPTSQRPESESFGVDVTYVLREIATNKVVVQSTTFARVSYDNPGLEQRFARVRGLRDAENRAMKVLSGQITTRLASYFVAGT